MNSNSGKFTNQFIRKLENVVNNSIAEKWLSSNDFSNHESCSKSILHSKMIGLISYVLQTEIGYYVEHEPRPWGGFKPDLMAFSKPDKCEALIEYESPNSYLDKYAHVGKDLKHYYAFHEPGDVDWHHYLKINTPKIWLIITSLPTASIILKDWKWKSETEWSKKELTLFKQNPQEFAYKKYKQQLSSLNKKSELVIRKIPLFFFNISPVVGKKKIRIQQKLEA
jgi:hypothetical protein